MKGAEPEAIDHPQHVHRLLRLIREGTPSHASQASVLLGRYAASCCAGVIYTCNATVAERQCVDGSCNNGKQKHDISSTINPGLIIWDLIGRLVGGDGTSNKANNSGTGKREKNSRPTSGLFDYNWATRSNSAMALGYVARCLPLEDRRTFFEDDGCSRRNDKGDTMHGKGVLQDDGSALEGNEMWLNVNDLRNPTNGSGSDGQINQHQINGCANTSLTSLKNGHNQTHFLDIVAEHGRLLLSSSGEKYDWTCDIEANEYAREQEALNNLDATAAHFTEKINDPQKSLQQSFLTRRVKLQRQILARRLGLGGILSAPIVAEYSRKPGEIVSSSGVKRRRIVDDIVADEDLIPKMASSKSKCGKLTSETAIEKSGKRSKKCHWTHQPETKQNEMEEKSPAVSIRALLVLESKRFADGLNCSRTQHHNPQTLLASELAYRTFDPDWTVRHGALLGTLTLLRAWKVHEISHLQRNNGNVIQDHHETHKKIGRWPQDILARCICILALDQFADFSGASCQSSSSADTVDGITTGAIVAPVREMAAQIIAILLEALPPEVGDCTHQLLMHLYNRQYYMEKQRGNNGWTLRHGVLLSWKYICALALFYSNRKGQPQLQSLDGMVNLRPLSTCPQSQIHDLARYRCTFNNIISQSVRGLSDDSDDNRAVAAQVLRFTLMIDASHYTIHIAKVCSKPLWDAIIKIRESVSSCAGDLLHFLAQLLSHDCPSFLSCLQEVLGSFTLDSILTKLTNFIGDDSIPVKMSSFCALSLVAEPITKAVLVGAIIDNSDCNASHVQPVIDCATTLCQLLRRLFETFFIPDFICRGIDAPCGEKEKNDESAKELSKHRNQAWSSILSSLALLTQPSAMDAGSPLLGIINDTFNALTLRHVGVCTSSVHSKDSKALQSYKVMRSNDTISIGDMGTETLYCSRLASASALASFYEKILGGIHSKEQLATLTEKVYSIFQSPWSSQCEAGYLLHICLTSSAAWDSTVDRSHPFFVKCLPFMIETYYRTPTCILLEEHVTSSMALNNHGVQSICDNGFAMLLDSSRNCSPEDVVHLWEQAFTQKGVSFGRLRNTYNKSLTKASMRLSASISGALVACGSQHLPSKITPIIRALMTSLKNEESHSRRIQTCHYISQLVSILSGRVDYKKARNKLLENVCSIACNSYVDSSGPPTGAKKVIELLVSTMSSDEKLEYFPPIWDKLSTLLDVSSSGTSEQQLSDGVFMLGVISKAMSKESPSFKHVLNSFTRSAVAVACKNHCELLRTHACISVTNFCRIDFCATMDLVVPLLLPILTNLQDNRGRERGCRLLLSILHDFEVPVARYATTLLPVSMSLMTDAVKECSRLACQSFAILVRIAPLAASHIDKYAGPLSNGDSSNKVIHHLILGKPLPPCVLPEVISSELRKSGTILRPYQMEGISWLKFLTDVNLNGALCDDMGLGKTLQALVAVAITHHNPGERNEFTSLNTQKSKMSLVICPSSVVGHWVNEIRRFFPGDKIFDSFDFTGSAKARRAAWHASVNRYNVVVTSYSVLRNDINLLEDILWDWCILDEGHLLKNPKTSTAKASRRLKAHHKLILTGTPIQNNVHEIWATFDFLMPNFLGTQSSFLKEFAKPIIKSQALDASAAEISQGMESLKILHQQVLPFILRRDKSQVIKELPPKIITNIPCLLSKDQNALYQQTLKKSGMKEALEMVDSSLVDTEVNSEDAIGTSQLGGDVLTSLLQLRLICTHPLLHSLFSSKHVNLSKEFNIGLNESHSFTCLDCSGKLSALNDLLRHSGIAEPEMSAADNDESGFLVDINSYVQDSSDCLEKDNIITLKDYHDSVESSSDVTMNSSSKCLIFAQFIQSLDIVERLLFEPHMPSVQYLRLDGRVPSNRRNAIVELFNQDRDIRVLLLTTRVGGLGLNLTGADKVIFLEPDWNPFVDLQAMDRAHRIGQTKTVNVYRLITSNTIEEKIMEFQQRKKATSEAVVNADNSTMFSMGTDRLLDIFRCRGDNSLSIQQQSNKGGDEDVLSYLDNDKPNEYCSLSVDSFLRGLI